ncbi:MAG: hypothetical protein HQK79_05365 [Desulfobacterales bacterium]|nr:hypothetical protein [Desulfobacterales bacterium]MBF0397714.1 hypothetical protein [Desulfobacterales bacterium]
MESQRKLKNFLINKKMQLKITIKYIFLFLFYSIFLGIIFFVIIWPEILNYVPHSLINDISHNLILTLLIFALPLFFTAIIFCIILTHKIAGPLHQIENKLDKLIKGEEVDLIRLRKGDELTELANKLNKLLFNKESK